ncbi:hypothetical protein SOCE26_030760 [Sorangium cellulosum]|uniref:Secreted protein n=1 Tax=Sorangium cellulosum TaxID=56 RepID=A0A2L0EQU2_SORCE|nr:hypothetical protein [Sorangium cellulosum]AUX41654.1 hypothetical protein SOCE26_030760 [Sorangium cellulosum]
MTTSWITRSLVLAGITALAGCHKEAPPQAPPAPGPAPSDGSQTSRGDTTSGGDTPAAGSGSNAAPGPRCATDADCVVSCAREGDCCDQLCPPCDQAFHREALGALQQWRAERCAAASCPVAKCMAPKEDSVARCSAGQCVAERVPRAAQ